jgi:hypothetical protein
VWYSPKARQRFGNRTGVLTWGAGGGGEAFIALSSVGRGVLSFSTSFRGLLHEEGRSSSLRGLLLSVH